MCKIVNTYRYKSNEMVDTVGEMVMVYSSRDQVSSTPTAPVQRVSRVPYGVRPEEGELAAGLCDLADLGLKMS